MESQTSKWTWIWAAIAIAAIAAAGYLYLHPRLTTVTRVETQFKEVPVIQKVAEVRKVYVPVKQVAVLDKAQAAEKLDLPWLSAKPATPPTAVTPPSAPQAEASAGQPAPVPDQVQPAEAAPVPGEPEDLQVTTTADIPECPNGAEAVTVLNTQTGLSSMIVKEKAAPWFQFENGLIAGLRYGLNTTGGQSLTPYVGLEFLRVKDVRLIGYGEVNNDLEGQFFRRVEGKVQFDLQYRRP